MAWDPMTSTLIYGENDAVLVDPLTTVTEAEALAGRFIADAETARSRPSTATISSN